MCTNDKYASPYLLRPPRSHEQVIRERVSQARMANRPESPNGAVTNNPARGTKPCGVDAIQRS